MKYKILVVDDEPLNVRLLERIFNRRYQVLCAFSGKEALEILRQHDVALIISDQRMPEMNGIEFLKLAAAMRPRVIRIIISGYADVNVLTEALNGGLIYRFVSKPWINEDLEQTVSRSLEHYEIIKGQHELEQTNERLTRQVNALRRLLSQLNVELAKIDNDSALSIENAIVVDEQHFSTGEPEPKNFAAAGYEKETAYAEAS